MTDAPKTLIDAVRYFSDLSVCNAYMRQIKWPDGEIACPHCSGERCVERADKKRLRCKDCRKEFSYKTGTLMEDSALPLSAWFIGIWCVAIGDEVSSITLADALGITQKSAWRMLDRIRFVRSFTPRHLPG